MLRRYSNLRGSDLSKRLWSRKRSIALIRDVLKVPAIRVFLREIEAFRVHLVGECLTVVDAHPTVILLANFNLFSAVSAAVLLSGLPAFCWCAVHQIPCTEGRCHSPAAIIRSSSPIPASYNFRSMSATVSRRKSIQQALHWSSPSSP